MNRRLIALILAAALCMLAFAGCGSNETPAPEESAPAADGGDEAPVEETEAAPTEAEGGEAAGEGEGLRIAIVTSPSGVDDGSFNQDNYNGIQNFIGNHPNATVTTIQEGDIANSVNAVADIVGDFDVVVTPGFQFAGISSIAIDNPDKKFILIDSFPSDPDDPNSNIELDNIYAMTFKEHESGFFAGMAAALETESGKVAVVNGIAYPSNVNYQYGFEAGVNYANAKLGTTATVVELPSRAGTDVTGADVGGNYVGDFNDEATGKMVGNDLISEGCDVLFVAAGNSGNGVFTAAKENGSVKVIGCDVDQYDDGVSGDGNIMLTSGLKVMSINVERALAAIEDGSFKGQNVLLGADTDSTGYVKADGRHQLKDETVQHLDEAYELIKSGAIVPPDNFSGTTPEDFPGLA